MRFFIPIAVAIVAGLAGCVRPAPPAPVLRPVAQAAPPRPIVIDWFQRQLIAARTARRNHQPVSDKAGAQAAYDDVIRTACQRVALDGPDRYKARCNTVLAQIPAPQTVTAPAPVSDPFRCEENTDNQDTLRACND